MSLAPGTRLGPYEIVAPLGAGGMGEVFRARDARLGRDVAIKVLPAGFVQDPERLARFEREARLLAAMNHPGIAAIYGLEDAGGQPALVMEVVEGPTLAERIMRGALPEDEALTVARQIADALEYAHDLGIVHRDLKPANVKLRPDGTVKVLDFGLARALDPGGAASSGELTQSPTLTQRMTHAGVILGTAAYMSPEQARGREVDRRADIWSFGAVLYEMLTGRRAFGGETISDTLASVMRDEPDWSALPAGIAPGWRRLIGRCLAKDPKQRLQAIGEARIAMLDLSSEPAAVAAAGAPSRGPGVAIAWSVAVLVLAFAGFALSRRAPAPPAATEVSVTLPTGHKLGEQVGYHFFSLAPDGRSIAYASREGARTTLHLRRLDRREDIEFVGTDGARNMFFSPDGEWIAFFDSQRLCKVSTRGGTPVVLATAGQDRIGTWLADGSIVYAPEASSPLMRLPAAGGTPVAVTVLDTTRKERSHRFPCALAGGPWVVFTVGRIDSPGGYDDSPIDAVNVRTGERRRLMQGARRAIWAPSGYLVFDRSGDLYAMRIDPKDPRPTREGTPVLEGVGGNTSSGAGFFDISRDGTLAWVPVDAREELRQIGWMDRLGRWTPTPIAEGEYRGVILSPDATRALLVVGPGGGSTDLWLAELATGGLNRITFGNTGIWPVWLRDGARIAYARPDPDGGTSIALRRLDGAGGERSLFRSRAPVLPSSLTPDGGGVVFSDYGVAKGRIRTVRFEGDPAPHELPADAGNASAEQTGRVSPDGRWLAYLSTRTGREEVNIRSFLGGGGHWQVSAGGGGGIRWGRDSRELFFVSGETMMRVTLEPRGDELVVGQPETLFDVPPTPTEAAWRDYDYDRVHDRFLFTRPPAGTNERREVALSLGWATRLDARMRAAKAAK